ncbi:hypothetical protein BDZ94DRAFT_1284780 [Collybia nuda]|uniref:Uncharacterized protein n=1 Tax=Collybia nuda TaxID=64659 RepID=A0A9P6CF18_9AGAR|nr:hypothetical protein BDZ94DRAFT_1284780 [Collybia nuda]
MVRPDVHIALPYPTLLFSTYADPLLRPPLSMHLNHTVQSTIKENPDVFKITTPIKVDIFQSLLINHPNQDFVQSVCDGLWYGFWPWADFPAYFPLTWDESRPTRAVAEAPFLESQWDKEIGAGRFSASFGPHLLPGMYSMPIHAVPKPDNSDLQMVTDHSAGKFALNSVIPHSAIIGAPLDNLKHLGTSLLRMRKLHGPSVKLVVFKSDVKGAHCLMPMAFEWQIKQINTINGAMHVDHCACFGNSGSARIWLSFFSLVLWITRYNLLWYAPYRKFFPKKQTLLLHLFDELGIPHKEWKQVSGHVLKVIGFEVNIQLMSFTMPADSKSALLLFIHDFAACLNTPLKEFQRLAGWVNWALNVFPLLQSSLSNIYQKCSEKLDISPHTLLFLNNSIQSNLNWLSSHMARSDGIFLLKSLSWEVTDADTTLSCDACRSGMGFWYPDLQLGSSPIFFYEALCVALAVHAIQDHCLSTKNVVIYSDNTNTVDMFNSLRALPPYNPILISSVDVLISQSYDLRVLHIEGTKNSVADALSRGNFTLAQSLVPSVRMVDESSCCLCRESVDIAKNFYPVRENQGHQTDRRRS